MSIDPATAMAARNDWIAIVNRWPALLAALRPGGGNALSGMPGGGGESAVPIDVHVSDLLEEITQSARFYGRVLLDEVVPLHGCNDACYADGVPADECPDIQRPVTTSHMPGLLSDVASRYGHFTEGDEEIGLAFCDDASDYRERVRKTLERPAPPTYVGPCQHKGEDGAGCEGELYLREGRDAGTCKVCGTPFTHVEQREFIDRELQDRLMTPTEIVRALKIIGHEVKPGTVYKWVQRGRLVEAQDGLYRLADAKVLMETKGGAA